ncbi:MAG TPA: class I SAM-dependent methyltransferase [Actinomycetota bacterium]|nr:class I SAM-dependent methyltransferase [Actinomycetota bacterium]
MRNTPHDVHDDLRRFWNADADVYDRSPTHAGTHPVEGAAWRAALLRHLPPPPARILDVGAGTGAISLLAAELGFDVTAFDLSPAMLDVAARKAADRGVALHTEVGLATEPPAGPFDAVVERHVLWTLPDPVAALRAWREIAPRLVSFEGVFVRSGIGHDLRHAVARVLRRLRGVEPEHHAEYAPDLIASLPLAGRTTPATLIEAMAEAGWGRYRLERLRDVEWARRRAAPWPLGWVEGVPYFALVAEG